MIEEGFNALPELQGCQGRTMPAPYRLPRIDEPPPCAKVTDVRQLPKRLATCASCGGHGDKRRMIDGLEAFGLDGLHHGRCVVAQLTPEQVVSLSPEQTAHLRLNETGVDLMRRLLNRGTEAH